jgi:hypothetical protein
VPADQIFVLMLVAGIAFGLGWLSFDSRRRAERDRQRQEQAGAAVMAESPAAEVREPVQPARRQRRAR